MTITMLEDIKAALGARPAQTAVAQRAAELLHRELMEIFTATAQPTLPEKLLAALTAAPPLDFTALVPKDKTAGRRLTKWYEIFGRDFFAETIRNCQARLPVILIDNIWMGLLPKLSLQEIKALQKGPASQLTARLDVLKASAHRARVAQMVQEYSPELVLERLAALNYWATGQKIDKLIADGHAPEEFFGYQQTLTALQTPPKAKPAP